MRYLIDTNILIERGRTKPHPKVKRWFDSLVPHQVILCPIVAAEFMAGVFRLPAGKRAPSIRFLREAIREFAWIPVDLKVAVACGELRAGLRFKPRVNDLWLASVAKVNGLTIATRNETDFKRHAVPVFNPFS
jgi:predicted nucleic acid-binding protein